MKTGRNLFQLAQELERQAAAKRDFVGDTRQCAVAVLDRPEVDHRLVMQINGAGWEGPINQLALRQIGDRLQIPAKYVDRLAQDHPDMLAYNINALFSREPEKRMIRTLDGRVRAFLSDSYRPIDNFDVAELILRGIHDHRAEIESCDVTEKSLYIKATVPRLQAEIPPPPGAVKGQGHTIYVSHVQGGLVMRNSEVGCGSFSVSPAIVTKECTNLAIFKSDGFRKTHVGKRQGANDDDFREYLQADTLEAEDAALFKRIRDMIAATLDGRLFEKITRQLTEARTQEITRPVQEFAEISQKHFGFTEGESKGILDHLIRGGEFTKYGFHAAVTRYSADVEDYERATELESVGGQIIELPRHAWSTIAVDKAA